MTHPSSAFPAGQLRWLIGIEDTCVYPQPGSAMGTLNEFELTGHDAHWREDLETAAELGATGIRYGVSWPLVHTAPGVFDWSELDERFHFAVHGLGLTVIADLVHYGTPTWLDKSFASTGYPAAIADFAGAFAARYRGIVDHITPLNEPLTTASFCGLRGVWPPALTGWAGWCTVATGIARGVQKSVAAIRTANADAVIVHVEASAIYETLDDHLIADVAFHRAIATLPTDLILGRVDPDHPLHGWMLANGTSPALLDELQQHAAVVDLMGVNYYPDLTPRVLEKVGDTVRQVTVNRWSAGLREVLLIWAERYGIPILVTETSIEGSPELRRDWLTAATATLQELHLGGVDVRGLTWWPLLDFIDWSIASGGRNVEEFVLDAANSHDATAETFANPRDGLTPFFRRMGLLTLIEQTDAPPRRELTVAAHHFPKAIK